MITASTPQGQMRHLYNSVDPREHAEAYHIGRGEQGVFYADPYESELLPLWSFKDAGHPRTKGIWRSRSSTGDVAG